MRRGILEKICLPQIGSGYRRVAVEPGCLQTQQLQSAIDVLSETGGGVLELEAGTYRTGALQLKSGVELRLSSPETRVEFTAENQEQNYPLVFSYWEATPCYNYSALLYACDAQDIAVTGCGVLDGGADPEHWWNWHHQVEQAWSADRPDLQSPARIALRQMNEKSVPVEQRIFGKGHWLRPNFVQFIRCERVLIQGVTLKHSPMWQINPVQCSSVTVDGVCLSSHGPNNDGCDPESCRGVWIKNCRFDTGDDCISLKSGRDNDGRLAHIPCEDVLIEHNEFADGHGGIALGSEMSGGIRRVLARENHFSSPNLTYALRLKTNARRGGCVEQILLCDSVMDHVHGAAVHGTMLYEEGRNGNFLPRFRDITIENITAHGGEYGIFLEAFPEVPIVGLILRNIQIDGVRQPLRSMNWKDAVVENVCINGKSFPRPGYVRILGIPIAEGKVRASAECCGARRQLEYEWEGCMDGIHWEPLGTGPVLCVPQRVRNIRVWAVDEDENREPSIPYRVLNKASFGAAARLYCRGMMEVPTIQDPERPICYRELAEMLVPLGHTTRKGPECPGCTEAVSAAIANGFFPAEQDMFDESRNISRQEMATVAMQACGVDYRNASSTKPVCVDVSKVSDNYSTNVARAIYFGFMPLDLAARFEPEKLVTVGEAVEILNRVADFAGL